MNAVPTDLARLVTLLDHSIIEHEDEFHDEQPQSWDEELRDATRELVRHRRAQRATAGLYDYYEDMAMYCEARIAIALAHGGKP